MCLQLADECLETAMIFYMECGHPNAAHCKLMLADREADVFLDETTPSHAVIQRRYPAIGPWRGGC